MFYIYQCNSLYVYVTLLMSLGVLYLFIIYSIYISTLYIWNNIMHIIMVYIHTR